MLKETFNFCFGYPEFKNKENESVFVFFVVVGLILLGIVGAINGVVYLFSDHKANYTNEIGKKVLESYSINGKESDVLDGWGNKFTYTQKVYGNNTMFTVTSSGEDKTFGNVDDISFSITRKNTVAGKLGTKVKQNVKDFFEELVK